MNTQKTIPAVKLSIHACKRARERYKWNSITLERMAEKALNNGLKRKETKGTLKKYLDDKYENHANKKQLFLYGETVYLFSNEKKLVTMWPLPLEYRALAKVLTQKMQRLI